MIKRECKSTEGARHGATMMEMAVVAPLVLILLLGMADLGIAVYSYNTVAEAVRAGTRYAQVHGSKSTKQAGPSANNAEVEKTVKGYAPGIQASSLTVTSTWLDGDNNLGSRVQVTVNYNYKPAVVWVLGVKNIPVSSTSSTTITH